MLIWAGVGFGSSGGSGGCFLWLDFDTCSADVDDPLGDHIASDHNEDNQGELFCRMWK